VADWVVFELVAAAFGRFNDDAQEFLFLVERFQGCRTGESFFLGHSLQFDDS
jgi:hypothetical protein